MCNIVEIIIFIGNGFFIIPHKGVPLSSRILINLLNGGTMGPFLEQNPRIMRGTFNVVVDHKLFQVTWNSIIIWQAQAPANADCM
jgi:hypothetical protein